MSHRWGLELFNHLFLLVRLILIVFAFALLLLPVLLFLVRFAFVLLLLVLLLVLWALGALEQQGEHCQGICLHHPNSAMSHGL